jgi:hypothetical protein
VIISNNKITVHFPSFVSILLFHILYIHISHRYWWRLRLRVPDVGVLAMRGFPENKIESMTVDHNMWSVWRIPPSMNVENHFVDVENDIHIVTAIKVVFVPTQPSILLGGCRRSLYCLSYSPIISVYWYIVEIFAPWC